jgi:hypothetical protein
MIEQRDTACEKISKACRDTYEQYSDDTTSKCRSAPQHNAGKMCDHFIYGELHMGFRAAKLLTSFFNIGLDRSPRCVLTSLDKLNTLIESNLCSTTLGGYNHQNCAFHITALVEKVQAVLRDTSQLPLTRFGRKQAVKRVVSWDSVLTGAEERVE